MSEQLDAPHDHTSAPLVQATPSLREASEAYHEYMADLPEWLHPQVADASAEASAHASEDQQQYGRVLAAAIEEVSKLREQLAVQQADAERARAELATTKAELADVQKMREQLAVQQAEKERAGEDLAAAKSELAAIQIAAAAAAKADLEVVQTLREQLAAQQAVSERAQADAAAAISGETAAKAELLAFKMAEEEKKAAVPPAGAPPLLKAMSSTSKVSFALARSAKVGEDSQDRTKRYSGTTKTDASEAEEPLELERSIRSVRSALDEISSMTERWDEEEAKEAHVEQLSTLIEAKMAAAQYAFERDEARQRSRKLRGELDAMLKRIQPALVAGDMATGDGIRSAIRETI